MTTLLSSESFTVTSYVRGYHAYMDIWHPYVGETLPLEREPSNPQDSFSVAVKQNGAVVGHIPFNLAPTVSAFLRRSTNSGVVEVTGTKVNRGGGYGIEIPCKYHFHGPKDYVEKLKAICIKLKGDGLL